jgi:hypothetical protein
MDLMNLHKTIEVLNNETIPALAAILDGALDRLGAATIEIKILIPPKEEKDVSDVRFVQTSKTVTGHSQTVRPDDGKS